MRAILGATVLSAVALAGCGGGDKKPAPAGGPAVIKAWADSVRAGNFATAADLFATPATVANGSPPLKLADRDDVDAFNKSFPCGAVLENTVKQAEDHLLATFRLVKADDTRTCQGAVGAKARVSFLIEDGKIREWVRVSIEPPPGTQTA